MFTILGNWLVVPGSGWTSSRLLVPYWSSYDGVSLLSRPGKYHLIEAKRQNLAAFDENPNYEEKKKERSTIKERKSPTNNMISSTCPRSTSDIVLLYSSFSFRYGLLQRA